MQQYAAANVIRLEHIQVARQAPHLTSSHEEGLLIRSLMQPSNNPGSAGLHLAHDLHHLLMRRRHKWSDKVAGSDRALLRLLLARPDVPWHEPVHGSPGAVQLGLSSAHPQWQPHVRGCAFLAPSPGAKGLARAGQVCRESARRSKSSRRRSSGRCRYWLVVVMEA